MCGDKLWETAEAFQRILFALLRLSQHLHLLVLTPELSWSPDSSQDIGWGGRNRHVSDVWQLLEW